MLLSRAEMSFDFGGARLDPVRDRAFLGWVMNQFLYGEVAANQIGEWLYLAPDLEAARFLARQAVEELQHVDAFVTILRLLDVPPARPHRVIRFLVTGMRGRSWPEHVSQVMATGEGLVLTIMFAVIDLLDHPEAVAILQRAARQEERHVAFGETQTMRLLRERPRLRPRLLGLSVVTLWAVRRLAAAIARRLPGDSPLLPRLPEFAQAVAASHELRLQRMGILDGPYARLPVRRRLLLVAGAYAGQAMDAAVSVALAPLRLLGFGRKRLLTDHYLDDPGLRPPAA